MLATTYWFTRSWTSLVNFSIRTPPRKHLARLTFPASRSFPHRIAELSVFFCLSPSRRYLPLIWMVFENLIILFAVKFINNFVRITKKFNSIRLISREKFITDLYLINRLKDTGNWISFVANVTFINTSNYKKLDYKNHHGKRIYRCNVC